MKYLAATKDIPPKLKQRQQKTPIPKDPTTAWNNYRRKPEIRKQLLIRQKGLCAYCEIELGSNHDTGIGRHIEHILSKSRHPRLTFEYSNMLLSCFSSGSKDEVSIDAEYDSNPVSCGHANDKKTHNWDESLFIKPTDSDCERYFSFELEGEIIPHPELNDRESQRAQYTIDLLNLNCLRLKRFREEIIEKGYNILEYLQDDELARQNFLELEFAETNGKLFTFINLRRQHFS